MISAALGRSEWKRWAAFVELCVYVSLGVGLYLYSGRGRTVAAGPRHVEHPVASTIRWIHPAALAKVRGGPHVAFRNMAGGADFGVLSFVSLDAPGGARETTNLACARAYEKAGAVLCLDTDEGRFPAYLLDESLQVRHTFKAPGLPSRVRVSRDGKTAAFTVFSAADSYMATGFSTRTRLVDVGSGETVDLEQFSAWRDGEELHSADFNYWGVTFTSDRSTFFATLGTRGHTYLVKGGLNTKRVVVVADGVECPSLSPDETRVAFKKKVGGPRVWRPAVLDLETLTQTVLAETRRIDDQIEWLDDQRVLYAVRDTAVTPPRTNIWMLPANGTGAPTLFLPDAESPAVVRR